ncbi:MAG TPA: hypothetical protein ENO29_04500 [Candidatus Aminicenantes bacterium]|nr:hypothetical protein [Candidatus Aminicenantes bacterium]
MKRAWWLFCLGLSLALCGPLFSGSPEKTINNITILVDGQPADESIKGLINIRPGDEFSDFYLDRALKQLMRSGFYSQAEIIRAKGPNLDLVFNLTRNIIIRNVKISAMRSLSRRISSEIPFIRKGNILNEAVRQRAIQEIKKILQEEGLFSSQVKFETRRIENTNQVDVFISLPSWKRLTIHKISFTPQNIIPEDQLKKYLKLNPGDYYVPRKLNDGLGRIKSAFKRLGYQWAEVSLGEEKFNQEKGTVDLAINLDPSVKIKIQIVGANLSTKMLQPVWEQKVFEEWALSEGEAVLLKYLRKKGYIFATIRSEIKNEKSELKVSYIVHPGPRLRIEEIEFRGNKTFSAKLLKKALGIGEKFLFLPYLDGEEVYELPGRISLFYEEQGFPQATVSLNYVRQGNAVKPILYIEEGPRQMIKSLEIQGAAAISSAELIQQLDSRPGRPYYRPALQRDLEKINLAYLNRGFRGTQVNFEAIPDRENNYDVVIHLVEGRRMKIDNIFITGNRLTSKKLVLRELRLRPGDWADYSRMLESKRNLDSLGVFSEVKIEELPSTENSINLSVQLREGEQNYAGLGLGVETKDEVRSVALWENNPRPRVTAEYIRYNLFRNASQVSFVGQLSVVDKRLVGTWQQPYIFGLKMRTYLSAYWENQDRTTFSYERRGMTLSTMRNLPGGFSLVLAAGALRTRLTRLEISESQVERERLPYSIAYGSATFIRDSRDDTFNPQNGYFFSLALERAYPLFHTESNFTKVFTKFQYFYPLAANINFNTMFRLGLASGTVPIPERFFAGGSNSFRGVSFEMLGPKDPESGLPLGGKMMFLVNMETRFILFKKLPNLSGALFYDMGNIYPEIKNFNFLKLSQAAGLGLRYRTPLGPVRFDVGWNLNPPNGKWKPLFFLTIGNMF